MSEPYYRRYLTRDVDTIPLAAERTDAPSMAKCMASPIVGIVLVVVLILCVLYMLMPCGMGDSDGEGRHSNGRSRCASGRTANVADALTTISDDAQLKLPSNQVTVILFTASWCPHCPTAIPAFKAAARDIAAERSAAGVNAIHAPDCPQHGGALGVMAYPTAVRIAPDGTRTTLISPKSVEQYKQFMLQGKTE